MGSKKPPPSFPKLCHTYPIMMKLDTVTPYLKNIQNGYGLRVYAIFCYTCAQCLCDLNVFLRKLRCLELSFFLEILVTLLEEQALSCGSLHPNGQFPLSFSQLFKTFKYLTKLSRSLLQPFGFKCSRLLFKCFLGLMVGLLIKGI